MKGKLRKVFATLMAMALLVTGLSIGNIKQAKASTIGSSGDYTVTGEDVSSSVSKITFNASNYAKYAIIHYKVNEGAQQNVQMSGSNTKFEQSITGLKKGDKITCSFTYNKGGLQYDSSQMTYIAGSASGSNTDSNIQAPFGLVVNSPRNNAISVVWGRGNIDSYNIYVDNNRIANAVCCGYYEFNNIAAGTHTVSVTTVSGSRESVKTSLSVTVGGQSQVTTKPTTTVAPTTTAEKGVVYIYQDINYGGRVAALNEGRYNLAALQAKGFKNDDLSSLKVQNGYEAILYDDDNFQGESRKITADTAWIGSDFNDRVSSIIVQKKTVETPAPTTTVAPTTTEKTNTDTSIAKPFGMVVSNPSAGTIGVVWGRGNINSYNVYIDGNKVASKVGCAYYTYSGYSQGTHTVAITTVSGNKESAKETMTVNVAQSGSSQAPATTKPATTKPATTTPSTGIGTDVPQLDSSIPVRSDKMFLQLNNKTNGKYKDSEIYWIVLGRNKNHEICYLDTQGNLVKASESLNTVTKNGRKCANIAHSMAEAKYVYLPDIESGRMYLSYGEPVYITFNTAADGTVGYAGPDLNNASDPNSDVLFEFAEFTVTNKEYWGNTTRVDFFSFPVVTRLVGQGGFDNRPGDYPTYDKTVGDIGTRDQIFNAWKNSAPAAWKSLYDGKRIMAPCKTTFNEGKENGHYFDNYINEFWNKYSNETLVFKCDAGTFRGRVNGDHMTFTKDGVGGTYTIYKPTTQDVLEGKGNFNRGNSTELVIEAQLCAAFNRGVATDPANYQNPSAYYKNGTYNYYSKFLHEHSVNNFSYGFCYDDVNDQSTLLHYTNPTALILDLKW